MSSMVSGRNPASAQTNTKGGLTMCASPPRISPRSLVVATRNQGKLREIAALLEGLQIDVLALDAFPHAPDVPEPHDTFLANAVDKAVVTARAVGTWAVADDSGLEVEALGGAPGVKSSRVAATDPARIAWLLERLGDAPPDRRRARFVCAIALASPTGLEGRWEESVEGVITSAPRGEGGFGYDPVFLHPPTGKTFAEMTRDEKSTVSHRGKALRTFRRALEEMLGGARQTGAPSARHED